MKKTSKTTFISTAFCLGYGFITLTTFASTSNTNAIAIANKMQTLGYEMIEKSVTTNASQFGEIIYTELRMLKKEDPISRFYFKEYIVEDSVDVFNFYKQTIAAVYSGGIPPANLTYNVGDFVLSRVNLTDDTNFSGFDMFSKNTIMKYTISMERGNNVKSDVVTLVDFLKTILPKKEEP